MKKPRKPYNLKNDRSENTKTITLWLSPKLKTKIKITAASKDLTVSEYIRWLVEQDIMNDLKGE